ncbi:hypothetical protein RR46_02059 [Papilio xuthus]|uniref:Uncharacterized protein n=1 Tax=Papilio xuthus TaxID=66420 RepID=A0A194QIP0_PAPXU|nr:hypothetical protein RR46_02059 [Papilio xuthus]
MFANKLEVTAKHPGGQTPTLKGRDPCVATSSEARARYVQRYLRTTSISRAGQQHALYDLIFPKIQYA